MSKKDCSRAKKVKKTKHPRVKCDDCGVVAEKKKEVCKPVKMEKKGKQ